MHIYMHLYIPVLCGVCHMDIAWVTHFTTLNEHTCNTPAVHLPHTE